MIIDSDKHPEMNIYFIGAQQLKLLRSEKVLSWDIHSLFNQYNAINATKISFDYHLLGLDWLYILGLILADDKGNVHLCI